MALIALVGFIVFTLLTFGVRTLVHYRRTGESGYVGISGAPGSVEWFGGVLFAVAMVASFLAPVVELVGLVSPYERLVNEALQMAGLACLGAGLFGTLWAQLAMGESWRIGVNDNERTALVQSGPFRWVRNPIFTAMLLATFGLVLLVPNPVSFIALVALIAAIEIQVRYVEEPYLVRSHGEHYRGYCQSTGRFIPGIGRLRADSRSNHHARGARRAE